MARGISNSNWMGGLRVVLQKGQMPLYCAARAAFSRNLWRAALLALLSAASIPSLAQSITPAPQNQPVISKSPQGQKDEAARAAARSPAHHFDRVLIIVLENVDYERAIQNKDLTDLAAKGASFTNFHALFHPSYPNYLAMIAGTDFDIHRRGSFLGDKQVNFPNDSDRKSTRLNSSHIPLSRMP